MFSSYLLPSPSKNLLYHIRLNGYRTHLKKPSYPRTRVSYSNIPIIFALQQSHIEIPVVTGMTKKGNAILNFYLSFPRTRESHFNFQLDTEEYFHPRISPSILDCVPQSIRFSISDTISLLPFPGKLRHREFQIFHNRQVF